MRRPGYLSGVSCWFGELASIGTPRWKRGGTVKSSKGVDHAQFAMIPGEGKRDRLNRLKSQGLYSPGQAMDIDYSNLVHYGTTDRGKIAAVRRSQEEWQRQENIKRYGTTDMKQILAMTRKK